MGESLIKKRHKPEPQPEEHKITPEEAIRCKYQGCPLNGSVQMAGDSWSCSYHAKGNDATAPAITNVIIQNQELFDLERLAIKLKADEFDSLVDTQRFNVSHSLKPKNGECHSQWVHRIKQAVHAAVSSKVNRAIDEHENLTGKSKNKLSATVASLASGVLINKGAEL